MSKIAIRQLISNDSLQVYKEIAESRDHLSNLAWARTATLDSVKQFIEEKSSPQSTSVLMGLFWEGKFAGCLEIRNKGNFYEPGYWLGIAYRGKGILQFALKTIFPLLDMPIVAHVRAQNYKSIQLLTTHGELEIVGFEQEWVILRKDSFRKTKI